MVIGPSKLSAMTCKPFLIPGLPLVSKEYPNALGPLKYNYNKIQIKNKSHLKMNETKYVNINTENKLNLHQFSFGFNNYILIPASHPLF